MPKKSKRVTKSKGEKEKKKKKTKQVLYTWI